MFTRENWTTLVSAASRNPRAQRAPSDGLRMNRSRAEPPGIFRRPVQCCRHCPAALPRLALQTPGRLDAASLCGRARGGVVTFAIVPTRCRSIMRAPSWLGGSIRTQSLMS